MKFIDKPILAFAILVMSSAYANQQKKMASLLIDLNSDGQKENVLITTDKLSQDGYCFKTKLIIQKMDENKIYRNWQESDQLINQFCSDKPFEVSLTAVSEKLVIEINDISELRAYSNIKHTIGYNNANKRISIFETEYTTEESSNQDSVLLAHYRINYQNLEFTKYYDLNENISPQTFKIKVSLETPKLPDIKVTSPYFYQNYIE